METVRFLNYKETPYNVDLSAITKYLPENEIKQLMPKKEFMPVKVEFDIHNTLRSIANGLRCVMQSEYPTVILSCEPMKDGRVVYTNDPYIFYDMVYNRIALIPIKQNIDRKLKFELNVENKTTEILNVYSRDIKLDGKTTDWFADNILICRLMPNTFMKIQNIVIDEGIAYFSSAWYSVTGSCVMIPEGKPLDERYPEGDERRGESSLVFNPRKFHYWFSTQQNSESPKKIIKTACDVIIARMKEIKAQLNKIHSENNTNTHTLILYNETPTVEDLIKDTAINVFNVDCITNITSHDKKIHIKITTTEDIYKTFEKIIEYIIDQYNKIGNQIKSN